MCYERFLYIYTYSTFNEALTKPFYTRNMSSSSIFLSHDLFALYFFVFSYVELFPGKSMKPFPEATYVSVGSQPAKQVPSLFSSYAYPSYGYGFPGYRSGKYLYYFCLFHLNLPLILHLLRLWQSTGIKSFACSSCESCPSSRLAV